jgi:hypothetical protein
MMKINPDIKPATPWNVTLAKLKSFEETVLEDDRSAMEARWLFGRELLNKRVNYKGQLGVPGDLMARTKEECQLSRAEISRRIKFAERYPTKKECSHAVRTFPTWHQMVKQGLIEKKREPSKKSLAKSHSARWVVKRLIKEVDRAFSHHATLTRDQVKDLEQLHAKVQALLNQIDRNDDATLEHVARKARA